MDQAPKKTAEEILAGEMAARRARAIAEAEAKIRATHSYALGDCPWAKDAAAVKDSDRMDAEDLRWECGNAAVDELRDRVADLFAIKSKSTGAA
jgi:hypothetical protein